MRWLDGNGLIKRLFAFIKGEKKDPEGNSGPPEDTEKAKTGQLYLDGKEFFKI